MPIGTFLSLNTWVDLRKDLNETESLQRLIAGAQGKAIDATAADKLLAVSPIAGCCHSASRMWASSSAANTSLGSL